MTKANVTMKVRNANGKSAIVDIQGEINAFAENALMDAYTNVNSQGAQSIILNFSDLEYMNSSGIGLLVTLLISSPIGCRSKKFRERVCMCPKRSFRST